MMSNVIKTCSLLCIILNRADFQSLSPPVWVHNTINPMGYREGNGTPVGSLIGTITAIARNGVPVHIVPIGYTTPDIISFTYNNTGNDATRYIYLKEELDREKMSTWVLFFKAYDDQISIDQVFGEVTLTRNVDRLVEGKANRLIYRGVPIHPKLSMDGY